jgi:hypothetical protein
MFEILPVAALLLLVPAGRPAATVSEWHEEVTIAVVERAPESWLTTGHSATDDPVTNGAVVGALIGAAAAAAVMAVVVKGGEGPDQTNSP